MKKILLLCGGDSNEREVSLASGRAVAAALLSKGHTLTIADVRSDLHTYFFEHFDALDAHEPFLTESFLTGVARGDYDVVYVALHGASGEDGHIQSILDISGIPYTGSSMSASAIGFDKVMTHEIVSRLGIDAPAYFTVTERDFFRSIHRKIVRSNSTITYPCIIKPARSGSSVGVSLVTDRQTCEAALTEAFRHCPVVIIQNYAPGIELSCAILGNTHFTEHEALPVIEIIPGEDATFFDYEQKYSTENGAHERCPAHIPKLVSKRIQKAALQIHRALHCDGLSRSDFIYDRVTDTINFLEINTVPGMTETSLCPQEARAADISFDDLVQRQIGLALQKGC